MVNLPPSDRHSPAPHEIREAMLRDYDKAAATEPKACATRVHDGTGKVHTLTETQLRHRKAAEWAPGVLAPPL
ncbi:hypothetical protein KPL74_05980 [Bacillus sp. NP157]|nr:hypothetical protein KPL74_05980 [Bacillus sp. NP157]